MSGGVVSRQLAPAKVDEYREWLADFAAFRKRMAVICDADVPTDQAAVNAEDQRLPKFIWAAEQHKAKAASYHKAAQEAKQPLAQRVWAKEETAGLVNALSVRAFAVARQFKMHNFPHG